MGNTKPVNYALSGVNIATKYSLHIRSDDMDAALRAKIKLTQSLAQKLGIKTVQVRPAIHGTKSHAVSTGEFSAVRHSSIPATRLNLDKELLLVVPFFYCGEFPGTNDGCRADRQPAACIWFYDNRSIRGTLSIFSGHHMTPWKELGEAKGPHLSPTISPNFTGYLTHLLMHQAWPSRPPPALERPRSGCEELPLRVFRSPLAHRVRRTSSGRITKHHHHWQMLALVEARWIPNPRVSCASNYEELVWSCSECSHVALYKKEHLTQWKLVATVATTVSNVSMV